MIFGRYKFIIRLEDDVQLPSDDKFKKFMELKNSSRLAEEL